MKNFKIHFLLTLAFVMLVSACDKRLEIDPQQSVSSNLALNTPDGVEATLIGAYGVLRLGPLYGGDVIMAGDLLASDGEIAWRGTFESYRQVTLKTMIAENAVPRDTWIRAYEVINIANNVINAVPVVAQANQNRVKGEALLLRAACYFELIRLYAQPWDATGANTGAGVPLILQPTNTINAASNVARSTIAEVYAQIIKDMTEAKTLLPTRNGTRFNTYTASAFLARVYLQQGNFAGALAEANTVISSGRYSLNSTVTQAFDEDNTPESIFEIQQNDQNNAGTANSGIATFYADLSTIGRGDINILSGHTNLYDKTNDKRYIDLIYVGTRRGRTTSGKWKNPRKNYVIIRLAEMYLIRAEANFRLGSSTGATPLEDINRIRNRAGLTSLATLTLDNILTERRLELAFEGARLHDIRRLKTASGTFAYNSPALVYPIPLREINANPKLTQNPGY